MVEATDLSILSQHYNYSNYKKIPVAKNFRSDYPAIDLKFIEILYVCPFKVVHIMNERSVLLY